VALKVVRMADVALKGKRVLIREDLNVPVKDGKVTSTARIDAALPTLALALDAGARVMVMSHLGRPKEGKPDPAASLKPVAAKLGELLGRKVPLAAIEQFQVGDRISYISTGGGAFLEFLEGKKLPAVATLEQRAAGG